jgi:6-pyruvoyl-tetrahydropterin synthase
MYAVTVRDQIMVAHSLRGEVFGPSQRLHGATYVVDTTFRSENLGEQGIVVDIARAAAAVRAVLDTLDHRNLDDVAAFADGTSTTERLARHIADRVAERTSRGALGDCGSRLSALVVTLHESPVAWASYETAIESS